jgi:DNA-binding MarR family transcriptional regulator
VPFLDKIIDDYVKFPKRRTDESLGFVFWQTTNLWQRKMNTALKLLGLTLAQFVLLAGIAWLERFDQPITQIRLARHARTDIMMTSDVLKTLEIRKLIERKQMKQDARANTLSVTKSGKELVKKAIDLVEKVDNDFFRPLGDQSDAFLQSLLNLLESNQTEDKKKEVRK